MLGPGPVVVEQEEKRTGNKPSASKEISIVVLIVSIWSYNY